MTTRIIWAAWLAASIGIGCLTAIGCGDVDITRPTRPLIHAPGYEVQPTPDYPLVPLPPKCPPTRICAT